MNFQAIELYSMEFEIPFISLLFIIMLIIVYMSKEKISSAENKIFRVMLTASFIEILLDFYVHMICSLNTFETITSLMYYNLFNIINKIIVISFATIFECLFIYILVITYNKEVLKNKILKIFLIIANLILLVSLCFTNIIIINAKTAANVVGSTPTLGYLFIALFLILSFFVTIKNYKKVDHRYLPIITIFIILVICYLATIFLPGMILYDFAIVILCYLMYFTIENPDMKLLKEMHEAKEISDNANEEKTLFLYNMTQEIRATTKNIDNEADIIIDSDDIDTDKESARNIKGETSKFRMMTNDILDVSAIDSSNIKIYNSSYNLKMLLRTIISSYTDICHNKNLEFRTNIDHSIPESLYGDNISLKKAINLLLTYSVKSTKKGYVELDINTIIKNDIVRLIITIEDSSMGIKSSDLEKIKIDNKNISESYKLITLMNGTMVLTSNYGSGNKIKIILDQKIDKTPNKEEKKYQSILEDKKILIIDNSEPSIKIIEKLLKGSNINIDYSLNGRDAYNKIKTRNRYDLILLDEELNTISGYEMLKNLQGIRNFNIPVILLSKDNKYEYNEEYLKMGFNDILIKPLSKEILLEKINKNVMNREDILSKKKIIK